MKGYPPAINRLRREGRGLCETYKPVECKKEIQNDNISVAKRVNVLAQERVQDPNAQGLSLHPKCPTIVQVLTYLPEHQSLHP